MWFDGNFVAHFSPIKLPQQGTKLVGNDSVGQSDQGFSVALSGDGNTAIVGGPFDNDGYPGAAWVYTRSGVVWTQQGSKLVGTGAVGQSQQGYSVALSGDGNTALVGGPLDNFISESGAAGAVWVYTRNGGLWTQQGTKLVGAGAVGLASQGQSVALSGDGNTAIVGGPADNSDAGAAWVFVQRTKDDCKDGGWLNFIGPPGPFTNQGQCVRFFSEDGGKRDQ
jgi:FG-GAP repeat